MKEFQHKDPTRSGMFTSVDSLSPSIISGCISVNDWCDIVSHVLDLRLPWRTLKARLVDLDSQGNVIYESTFRSQELQCSFNSKLTSVRESISSSVFKRSFRLSSAATVSVKQSIETKIYWKLSFELWIKITQVEPILSRPSLRFSCDGLLQVLFPCKNSAMCVLF